MFKERSVKLLIEGAEAKVASRDLFRAGWFEAEWAEQPGEGRQPATSTVRAELVALASGSVTTADKLLAWWAKWRGSAGHAGKPLKVVLEGGGAAVLLESATRDALIDVLRTLHASRRH